MNTQAHAVEQLRWDLASRGYSIAKTESIEGFQAVCGLLGRISQTLEVRITPGKTQYPYRPEEVPFHTDHPMVPIVAWHCVRQDADDGDNLLVDTREVISGLSSDTREILSGIRLKILHTTESQPLLSLDPYQVYWLPVIVKQAQKACEHVQVEAITALRHALERYVEAGRAISVHLQPGEAIFVNNHSMLHGRRAIASHSERFLLRAYVVPT